MDSKKRTNRLIHEKSPYLLQHARNPVDWHPWGNEAFERAKEEDKPVFLSIGYSTCHWCHVMERESFDDREAAALLNEAFVCVKVDREERPDLDQYYMAVCQALTGSGGWPLTILLTPEKKPFFAGTYFPKKRRWGRIGLMELIPGIQNLWRDRRTEVLDSAEKITASTLEKPVSRRSGPELSHTVLDRAVDDLKAAFDETCGGFGGAPKFPIPHHLSFLLRSWKRSGRADALEMVEKTLSAMSRGGIYDHLGFGFHRYSTDSRWHLPHFEKMLYDQALLSAVYLEAYSATGKESFKRTAFETLDYVLRELLSPEGGFYSAEDADSEGEEGLFYLWTEDEIQGVLGEKDTPFAIRAYHIRPEGNFREPGRGADVRNILHLTDPAIRNSSRENERSGPDPAGRTSPRAFEGELRRIREKLFAAREKRSRPFKDTKILIDWNGLMIAALAVAARVAEDSRYLDAAEKAVRFILHNLRDQEGRLYHVFSDGEGRVPGFLDDYAFLIQGLIELYQATFDPTYLRNALSLEETVRSLFWDGREGGYHFVPPDSELPYRKKELYDGAVPSGNSVMFGNLLRLARLTGREGLEERAAATAAAFAGEVSAHPQAYTAFLCGLDFALGPSYEVVIVGSRNDKGTNALLTVVNKRYHPNVVTLFKSAEAGPLPVTKIAAFTESMDIVGNRATAYICTGGRCLKPVTTPEDLDRALSGDARDG
jgi:uncharacterized protein YyaL (SSP411 family)